MNKPRDEEIQTQPETDSQAGGKPKTITPLSYQSLATGSKILRVLKPEDLKYWE